MARTAKKNNPRLKWRNPIIGLALPDKDGVRAEVRIESGFGEVTEVREMKSNAKVSFNVGSKFSPYAYIPLDDELYKVVKEAKEKNEPLEYRIEVVRGRGVDASIPIDEVRSDREKGSAHRQLSAVRYELDGADDTWIKSKNIVTLIEENPLDANEDGPRNPYDLSQEELDKILGKNKDEGKEEAEKNTGQEVEHCTDREAPSFKRYNSDGSINIGSNWVLAASSCFSMAQDVSNENNLELSMKGLKYLAGRFFKMANQLQKAIYTREGVEFESNPGTGSHIRARGFMHQSLKMNPVTAKEMGDGDARNDWLQRVKDDALEIWSFSIDLAKE